MASEGRRRLGKRRRRLRRLCERRRAPGPPPLPDLPQQVTQHLEPLQAQSLDHSEPQGHDGPAVQQPVAPAADPASAVGGTGGDGRALNDSSRRASGRVQVALLELCRSGAGMRRRRRRQSALSSVGRAATACALRCAGAREPMGATRTAAHTILCSVARVRAFNATRPAQCPHASLHDLLSPACTQSMLSALLVSVHEAPSQPVLYPQRNPTRAQIFPAAVLTVGPLLK